MFATGLYGQQAINDATNVLAVLDAVDADPVRRSAVIAAIRKAFP